MELYQLSREESSPIKLIISEASSQEWPLMKFSCSSIKSTLQSTKLSEETLLSKKVYKQEGDTKFPSTSQNKPLCPQSRKDIYPLTTIIPSTFLNTYLRMLTKTAFIAIRRTNTSTTTESSRDSIPKTKKTNFTTNHSSTRKSMPH